MTSCVHLSSLSPDAIADWNAATAEERLIDVAWLYRHHTAPASNVRLRFCGSHLTDISPVARSNVDNILPIAVIPPLVNPHTHLEFSTLTEPIAPPSPFPDWIRSVIRWRINNPDITKDGIRAGLQECQQHAVAGIGEITTSDEAVRSLQPSATGIVSFRELIGLLPDRIQDQINAMHRHLGAIPSVDGSRLQAGISPHAPYSVHPDLFTAVVDHCCQESIPVVMHLGETTDERELLDTGSGAFVEFLRELNLWDETVLPRGGTILDYLQPLANLPRALAVHCNYLSPAEIQFLGQNPQIRVVYCPRTHHYFGHAPHPWRQIRDAGGTMLLGTDGRSSNPDLSIWQELLFVAANDPQTTAEELLPMITTHAADALGLDHLLDVSDGYEASLIQLPREGGGASEGLLSHQSRPVGRLTTKDSAVRLVSVAD